MDKLLYSSLDLATVISGLEMGCQGAAIFLNQIWAHDRLFLQDKYRYNKRLLVKNVDFWQNYLADQPALDAEIPAILQDIQDIGGEFLEELGEKDGYDDADFDLFFKGARMRILFVDGQDCIKFRRRSLQAKYGKEKTSLKRLTYYYQRLYFYHLQTYIKNKIECRIEETTLDEVVTLRVV